MQRLSLLLLAVGSASARRTVKEYVINLDSPPGARYNALVPDFNATVWGFFNKYFAKDVILRDALYALVDLRGKESDAEMQAEIDGLANASKLPAKFVHGIQTLYELQTIMVPIVNFSHHSAGSLGLPKGWEAFNHTNAWNQVGPRGWEALTRLPWRGPGCTGIIALDKSDGTVNHARNLDFAPVDVMTNLVYTGIFTRGGKEVFRSQMVAGYVQLVTGMRRGPNGYAIERNTRYADHVGGFDETMKNVLSGRALNGWTLRKIMEKHADYEGATAAIAQAKYASPEYAIVSGVRKGLIYARNPEYVAHTQTLGQHNFEERDDYIIITNWDFFWHDLREYFDPTGGQIGPNTRRVVAQRRLNASAVITPAVLFETINGKGTIADTIFQAIINVEKDVYNVSLPDL
jgi:hypothetical protein